MPRLKITLAYVGTQYCGWQIQENGPTIQAEMEKVLQSVLGGFVRVYGAGRTDSGVHANGQVAHFDVPQDKLNLQWRRIFNTSLPQAIRVLKVEQVSDDFHSRFDAISKTYHYIFHTEREFIHPRLAPFAWSCGPLDIDLMRKALKYLHGKHDFACFQNAGTLIEDTVREIYSVSFLEHNPWVPAEYHKYILTLSINADGFLKQMVRNIAGLLAHIGRGNMSFYELEPLLLTKNRQNAPLTAPACGLTLQSVHYRNANKINNY